MASTLSDLRDRVSRLQQEIEESIGERRDALNYTIRNRKVIFEREVIELHRRARKRLLAYLAGARLSVVLTAPVIYSLVVPLALLDLAVTAYQAICFPAYGLTKAKRSDYIVFDRHKLAYLNGLEKLNCIYCSYANGLIAYIREIAARTEPRWCPIKHSRSLKGIHPYHAGFADYGDAGAYRAISDTLGARKETPHEAN